MKNSIFILCFFFFNGLVLKTNAQYKSYKLTAEGDTINAVDKNDLKTGKWMNHIDEVRGEPGFEEEGVYLKGKKDGIWRKYTLTGDIIAVEFYRFGGMDGVQQYYTFLGDLVREESWRCYNPDAPYDTIPVYGTGNDEIIDFKIVKAEPYSVKHGEWKYYDAGSGRVTKTETWNRGHLEVPGQVAKAGPAADKKKEVEKTPQMLEWEKKNKGMKNVVRDGRTGM